MNYDTPTERYRKKEQLLFHLVENFNSQYRSKFPFRRELLLFAQNEHNVQVRYLQNTKLRHHTTIKTKK